jgi:zinc protease
MKKTYFLLALALCATPFVAKSFLPFQSAVVVVVNQPPANKTAKQILEKYIEVIGGKQKLQTIQTLKISSAAEVMGMPITGITYKKAPNKFANLMNTPMGEVKQVYNGVKAVASGMMQTQVIEGAGMENVKMIASPFPELDFLEQGFTLTLKGKTQEEGGEAYEIEITSPKEAKITQWYDEKTGLKVKEQTGTTNTLLGDYKEINGVKFPHLIKINMQMLVELKVTSIEINPTLLDTLFEP